MKKHLLQYWLTYVVALVGLVMFSWATASSESFTNCMNKSYYESADQKPPKGNNSILSTLSWARRCSGQFFEDNGEAVTAIFTVILALSTIALWRVTKDAARAAQVAAEHIPTVEGAFVYAVPHRQENVSAWIAGIANGTRPRDFSFEFTVKNFGKTPAGIIYGWAMLSFVDATGRLQGEYIRLPSDIVGAGEQILAPYDEPFRPALKITPEQARKVRDGGGTIIIQGSIVYFDIWNSEWATTFDGRYDQTTRRFRLDNQARRRLYEHDPENDPPLHAILS